MDLDHTLPLDVVRRSERAEPLDDRRLRARIAAGEWVRIAPGSFAPAHQWTELSRREQHRVRVLEALRRMKPGAVLSHRSASALWRIDTLGAWPAGIEVTIPRTTGGRSSGVILRRTASAGPPEVVAFGAHFVTTPRQTALDLARSLPHVEAVAAVDQALWERRSGGALTRRSEILELCEATTHRGNARALRAIEFASSLAANPRESQSRVVIVQLGFPQPRVQERRVLRSGRVAFADFYFPDEDHWCELDGRGKYLSPEFGPDRAPSEIVIDEKNRENEIRREVRGFSRWEPVDADRPRRLFDILTSDGMRSALPRP